MEKSKIGNRDRKQVKEFVKEKNEQTFNQVVGYVYLWASERAHTQVIYVIYERNDIIKLLLLFLLLIAVVIDVSLRVFWIICATCTERTAQSALNKWKIGINVTIYGLFEYF